MEKTANRIIAAVSAAILMFSAFSFVCFAENVVARGLYGGFGRFSAPDPTGCARLRRKLISL